MSKKVNLKVNAERVFGKYLPAVYIETIEVDFPSDDAGGYITDQLKINPRLSINFTMSPKDITTTEVNSWFRDNFKDLYLYTWVSPHQNLNRNLENKRLNLKDMFNSWVETSVDTFTSADPSAPSVLHAMMESFATKSIDFFGMGGGTDGGVESIPTGVLVDHEDAAARDLATLYYICTPDQLYASVTTPGSIFHKLFWGISGGVPNTAGPWTGGESDIPEKLQYADPTTFGMVGDPSAPGATFTDPYFGDFSMFPGPGVIYNLDSGDTGGADGYFETHQVPDGLSFVKTYLSEFLGLYAVTAGGGDLDKTYSKIALVDLITDTGEGQLIKRGIYDSSGNEIFQIGNINLDFSFSGGSSGLLSVDEIEKLFLVTTIGLDVDAVASAPNDLFNNYFGGISYENILRYGKYDDTYSEVFVEAKSGYPYDGLPIQALNGKYYAEDPIGRKTVVDALTSVIQNYKKRNIYGDAALSQNIKNLQYVIETQKRSVDFFRQLKMYQKTYTHKSQATASGRFYAEVVDTLVQFSKKVMAQEELRKKLIMNSTVLDLRPAKFLSAAETYTPYNPDLAWSTGEMGAINEAAGFPLKFADASDDYIPRKWMFHTRTTMASLPDESESSVPSGGIFGSRMSEWEEMYDDYNSAIGDFPASWQFAEIFTENEFYNDPMADLLESKTGFERRVDVDFVCRNQGVFMFDWEKALRTQSNMSKLIKISKLHRFLGISIPYKYFKVKTVRLIRAELEYETRNDDVNDDGERVFYATMETEFSDGSDWPRSERTYYKVFQEGEWSDLSSDAVVDDLTNNHYGMAEITAVTETHEDGEELNQYFSNVRFMNFDVMASGKHKRLEGFGEFTPYGTDAAIAMGQGIRDGYRLMAFQYTDFMDDDLAYYNTMAAGIGMDTDGYGNRVSRLASKVGRYGDPYACYTVQITVEDTTIKFFIEKVYGYLYEVYLDLLDYLDYAEELCSYNNITNQFNDFYVNAVNEKYETADVMPWIRAAYVISACRQIFFSSFEALGAETENNILVSAVELVNRMGPSRGTLENLRTFVGEYKRFLSYFNPNITSADAIGSDIEISDTPPPLIFNRMLELLGEDPDDPPWFVDIGSEGLPTSKMHEFVNAWSINQKIHGDISLGGYNESDRVPIPAGAIADEYWPSWKGNPMQIGPFEGHGKWGVYPSDWAPDYDGTPDGEIHYVAPPDDTPPAKDKYGPYSGMTIQTWSSLDDESKEFGYGHIVTAMLLPSSTGVANLMWRRHHWDPPPSGDAKDYSTTLGNWGTLYVLGFFSAPGLASDFTPSTISTLAPQRLDIQDIKTWDEGDWGAWGDAPIIGGGATSAGVAKMAYLVELMLWIASGMRAPSYAGGRRATDTTYALRESIIEQRAAGQNIPRLQAGALLYVIRNFIHPVTNIVDQLMTGANDPSVHLGYDGSVGTAYSPIFLAHNPEIADGVTSFFDADNTGWSAWDVVWGSSHSYRPYDQYITGVGVAPPPPPGDESETYSLRKYGYQLAMTDGLHIEPIVRYHMFRGALKVLHNALCNIVFEKHDYIGAVGTLDPTASAELGASSDEYWAVTNIVRSYLDPWNPAGPDYSGLVTRGGRDVTGDAYHLDGDVYDDWDSGNATYAMDVYSAGTMTPATTRGGFSMAGGWDTPFFNMFGHQTDLDHWEDR